MCLTSNHKLKENFRYVKKGEAGALPKNTNSKYGILFDKCEACASSLSTILRKFQVCQEECGMCLTQKHKFKHKTLFDKCEACASPLRTSLRKKFRYVKKGKAYASPQIHNFKNIKFCFIVVRHVSQQNNEDEAFNIKISNYEVHVLNIHQSFVMINKLIFFLKRIHI